MLLFFILAALCAGIALSGRGARAETDGRPYDPCLSLVYSRLTGPSRELCDRLYGALRRGEGGVDVPGGLKREEAEWALDFAWNEAPELCAFERWKSSVGALPDGSLRLNLVYRFPIAEQERFIKEVTHFAAGFSGRGDAEGVRAIHDCVARRLRFGRVPGDNEFDAYTALKNNVTVCNGYAQTMAMLCHFAGYACSYVAGYAKNSSGVYDIWHAWNIACLDGRFVWIDATWDSCEASSHWFGRERAQVADVYRPNAEYLPIARMDSVLPEGLTFTMHLDVNDENRGFVRGVASGNSANVRRDGLKQGEYYSPALVLWNNGRVEASTAGIQYRLDGGERMCFQTGAAIAPGSNAAYRLYGSFADSLKGAQGAHEIIWYRDGFRLGSFAWSLT